MSSLLDNIAPAFRAVNNRWPNAPTVQSHYEDLERAFEINGNSLVELCISFLEMVCKTVIEELNGSFPKSKTPTTTQLLISTLDVLNLTAEPGSSIFGTFISGHIKISEGLSTLRRKEGRSAHGKDGFMDKISEHQTRVYLLATDTIISLILQSFDGRMPSLLKTRDPHDRFDNYNKKINSATQVEAIIDDNGAVVLSFITGLLDDKFELRYQASNLLYNLDRRAYVDLIENLSDKSVEIEEEVNEKITIKPTELLRESRSKELKLLKEYDGKFSDQVIPLYEYIVHKILDPELKNEAKVQNLAYTLLNGMEDLAVVDWSKRESTRSEVRLLVKKLGLLLEIDELKDKSKDQSLDLILEWLTERISGNDI